MPTSVARPPSATTLAAVFAAPPGTDRLPLKRTIGTGASGETRDESPSRYSSSITSPTMRMRLVRKADEEVGKLKGHVR